jgi:hypothetical protein
LLCTWVPAVGRKQARQERRRGLQVLGEVSEVVGDAVGELRSVCVAISDVYMSMSLWRGGSPSFYRPRRGQITSTPHYLATWGSMVCSAAE